VEKTDRQTDREKRNGDGTWFGVLWSASFAVLLWEFKNQALVLLLSRAARVLLYCVYTDYGNCPLVFWFVQLTSLMDTDGAEVGGMALH
jgi:hypothetical protein